MDTTVRAKLAELEAALLQAPARRLFESNSWADDITPEAGVYAIWDVSNGEPVYVGETSSLRSRMKDIGKSMNHTFRRKAAKQLGLDSTDEAALSAAMAKRYALSFIEVPFGRVELEEFLVLRWHGYLENTSGKRAMRGERLKWVEFNRHSRRSQEIKARFPP